jgi:1-acyl-sn-glycerol-3-phosphate acyltransferase
MLEAIILEGGSFLLGNRRSTLRQMKAEMASRYSDRVLKILNIHLETSDAFPSIKKGLLVCNHWSYIDVLVISKLIPSLFITSVEVKNSIGLGWITQLAGCLFVERRSRLKLESESKTISEALADGVPVTLFPEGTSTDGSKILPYRAALFQSAIDARVPIHNLHIGFDHGAVAYYGDLKFGPHLLKLCQQKEVKARISYLGELSPEAFENRKFIANQSYALALNAHTLVSHQ